MYNAKTVCESLRRLTTERNIKKTDLAKALGVTYPTIVKWLDGKQHHCLFYKSSFRIYKPFL